MSEKLTTQKLKDFIVERISEYTEKTENNLTLFGLENGDELDTVIKNWKRTSYWKRTGKKKIKEEWSEYFHEDEVNSDYSYLNKEQYDKILKNSQIKNCIIRFFQPEDEDMRENYYIFIISNPEDTIVVAFGLHQD